MITLNVNGVRREVQVPDDTPLLYVLRNDLQLRRSKYFHPMMRRGRKTAKVAMARRLAVRLY
jgi:aerobic-type carbon monoxide dehydrogenase small subunit (CoxS/CutS family)